LIQVWSVVSYVYVLVLVLHRQTPAGCPREAPRKEQTALAESYESGVKLVCEGVEDEREVAYAHGTAMHTCPGAVTRRMRRLWGAAHTWWKWRP